MSAYAFIVNATADLYNAPPYSDRLWNTFIPEKEEIKEKEHQIEALSRALGKAIIERDWL